MRPPYVLPSRAICSSIMFSLMLRGFRCACLKRRRMTLHSSSSSSWTTTTAIGRHQSSPSGGLVFSSLSTSRPRISSFGRQQAATSLLRPFHSGTALAEVSLKTRRWWRRRRRKKKHGKRKNGPTEEEDWRHGLASSQRNGRPCMTQRRWEEEFSHLFEEGYLQPSNAKRIFDRAKHKMALQNHFVHVKRGSPQDQMYFCTLFCAVDPIIFGRLPPPADAAEEGDSSAVELRTTGVDRSKKRAEIWAVLDLMAAFRGAGVDVVRNPPDARVLRSAEATKRLEADWAKENNGRPYMTKDRWTNETSRVLPPGVQPNLVKQILHNAQHKMLFQQRFTHETRGPKHDQMFFATIFTTVDRSIFPQIPKSASIIEEEEGTDNGNLLVELRTTGVARSKKQAEMWASVDLLALFHEARVDVIRNPPNLKALRRSEAKERFKADLAQAEMLLELCHASRPRFRLARNDNATWDAQVTMFVKEQPLEAVGTGKSKAEAEGRAVIAASGESLEVLMGTEKMGEYKALIENSPSGHVAALHVEPLPDEPLDALRDCLLDHEERMEEHMAQKALYEAQFARHGLASNKRQRRYAASHHPAINAAFLEEEKTRAQKASENPEERQGIMKSIRDALPIKAIRQELLDALRTNPVLVVSGGTGSGKSTQCPQYILEDAIARHKGTRTRIVVTQPRRIAAISVAERVAAERDERVGNSVGYSVRFHREPPRETGGSIEFVTTGVLLRRLVKDPTLSGVSHVMIDEVHERDIDTDFLLVLLKDLLIQRPELRVILMSATLDAESFGNYFSRERQDFGPTTSDPTPVMSVPTKPRYPVEVIHLEDLAGESTSNTPSTEKAFSSELRTLARSLLEAHDQQLQLDLEEADAEEAAAARLDDRSYAEDQGELLDASESSSDDSDDETEDGLDERWPKTRVEALRRAVSMRNASSRNPSSSGEYLSDKREIGEITVAIVAKIAQHVAQIETDAGRKGSILCFLPGWDEIKAAMQILDDSAPVLKSRMTMIPLHSTIPKEEQHKVFEPAEDGHVKVILATNIAESSVTIDDVLAVVDSGLVREMYYDAQSAMARMETVPISRASATQRLGRAGRVATGKCYRLFSRAALEAMMERPMPEIQRTALEATCLQTCSMTSNGVAKFLRRAMDPPGEDAVSSAMEHLVKLGAISVHTEGVETLTALGRCLSRLPLEPAIGRMLIMGCVMRCLDPVLTAAACFSSRDPFYTPPGMRDEARETRRSFCDTSDLMARVRAYDELQAAIRDDGWDHAKEWASDNFISLAAMNSIRSVRGQLVHELNRIGLVANDDLIRVGGRNKELREDTSLNRNADIGLLYSAVWASGLPANISVRRRLGHFGTLSTCMEEHAGLHPSSVAFHRKPPKGSGKLPRWFVYDEMVLSSQVFLRGCTALQPEQLILFGGYSLKHRESGNESSPVSAHNSVLDDWIIVEGSCQETIDLLSRARHEVNAALDTKVMHPRNQLADESQSVIDAVCNVLADLDDALFGDDQDFDIDYRS